MLTNPLSALLKTVGGLLDRPARAGWGTGTGSLEAARGSFHVGDGTTELSGEVDVFGQAWNGYTWAKADLRRLRLERRRAGAASA